MQTSAYDAVLICHCLSLAPEFRRFDDLKFSSLQDGPQWVLSPVIHTLVQSFPPHQGWSVWPAA